MSQSRKESMRRNKTKLSILSSLMVLLGSILFVCVGTVVPVIASILEVYEDAFFVAEDDGHTYKCYTFKDDQGHPVGGVAIAWGELPENTPATLNVPDTVRFNETDYTVRAVAKHGFRYCDFEEINLPQTIEMIEPEAFAYCINLKTFSMPHLVDKIATSTFLDCRKLETIRYTDASGNPAFDNNAITSIEDHAFDSCVSLRDFYCPKSCTYFGESCFKNCRNLINFYFPSAILDGSTITNPITVKPYALADCKSLIFIYFETNMSEIDNYAFVDCHSTLRIKYNGDRIPSYSTGGVNQGHWRDRYIATNLNDKIPVDYNHPTIYSDPEYPCLRYAVEKKTVPLESAQGRETINIIDQQEVDDEGEYAVIYKFDTPREPIEGCFEPSTGELTIPDTINGYTVKIIEESAFANNPYIKSVKFNENLVQICNKAFYNSTNIANLDFNSCLKLKEVSYYCFHDFTASMQNTALTSLILPNCLEYIGGYAFCKFVNVNEFKLPENIKAIDDLAFYRLGFSVGAGNGAVRLKLPKSLNDAAAKAANFKHLAKDKFYHNDYTRFYAVGKYAFNEANCLVTVEMENDPSNANNNDYTCSFYSNAFNGAANLIRFKASKNLQFLGKDSFKNCTSLKEIFLTTAKSDASGHPYPWCIDEEDGQYGGTLFWGSAPDLVCFVDGAHAPGDLEDYTLTTENIDKVQINSMWNAETDATYANQTKSGTNLGRKTVPTYFNVDFDSIFYWDPKTKLEKTQPMQLSEYEAGVVSFVKNTSDKYIAVRYYYSASKNTGHDYIDLTQVPGISDNTHHDLIKIGDSCFGRSDPIGDENPDRTKQPGHYFILPESIIEIGDRAFFRSTNTGNSIAKNNGRYGVRIVTYKNSSGNYYAENGSTCTEAQLKTTITNLEKNVDVSKRGYCVLPGNITSIGKAAFYNNIFRTVRITSSLNYLGVAAFYTHPASSTDTRALITTFVMADNDYFHMASNGIYYIGSGDAKKMLIYQMNGGTGTLTIEAGTKAIAMDAVANTLYETVNLPAGLTTIYGSAFAESRKLKTVNNVADIRYIGNMENITGVNLGWSDDGYTEVWDNSLTEHIANSDFRDYAYSPRQYMESVGNSFYNCTALTTINFKQMTELRKIGRNAFSNCSSMNSMTGNTNYVYKELTVNSDSSLSYTTITGRDGNNKNVLDLSSCSNLRSINKEAFTGCSKVKFLHLPDNRNGASESTLYIGYDPEFNEDITKKDYLPGKIISDNASMRVLVGETALYAHHDFGVDHNASTHYYPSCFGTGNNIYYYVGSAADIPAADSTSIKYWTKNNAGEYILIKNAKDARAYFGV